MSKKTVLITGCSQGGLGEAMAKVYCAKGFRVFATLRNLTKAGSLGEIKGIEILELDITSDESIRQCAKAVEKLTGGSLDILVNNAGLGTVAPLLDISIESAKKIFDINVWAMVAMAQAFAPMLIKAKGTMCNFSSVSSELVIAYQGVYAGSRAANRIMSEMLRVEMAPLGVQVVTVLLGGVATNALNNFSYDEMPAGSYYHQISDTIARHQRGEFLSEGRQNVDVAAKNIVNDVISGRTGYIRRGQASTLSWIATTFLPHTWAVSMLNGKNTGLAELSGKIAQ